MVKLTDAQKAELEALEAMPDDQIDYSDIPEMTEEEWAKARRGVFYKPDWQDVTLRLDRKRHGLVRRTGRNLRRSPPEHQRGPRGTHEKGEVPGQKSSPRKLQTRDQNPGGRGCF